jgi:hypothetical protein
MAEERTHDSSYGESGDQFVVVTPNALVVTLNDDHRRQIQHCLRRSGKVVFSMREISVTRMPDTLTHGLEVIID